MIVIRRANIDDNQQIFNLVKAFATSFKPESEQFSKSFKCLINDDSALVLVAEIDKVIIGYCLGFDHYAFYSNGRVSWLEEIMVEEFHRRNRVGEKLMKEFEDWSKSRGSKLIGLATRRASSFYKALEYEDSAIFFRKML